MLSSICVAVVTGSSRGIDAAMARQLTKDGYNIALNDVTSQKSIETIGRRGHTVTADASAEAKVKGMVDDTLKDFGRLDVVSVMYAPAYSAPKFAVRGLTQCAAQELGKYAITINTYAPGEPFQSLHTVSGL
ncbi:hypothetical protein AN958_09265 [Leucoagaricus sp. SymC.cos]|nr:hypothetical protein AN958_09265 [Leucoagaricus sp. SymC.cos]